MEPARPIRILVVANRTAATPRLLDEVRRRAASGHCEFTLLIPDAGPVGDWTLDAALPLVRRAARARVVGVLLSVEDAIRLGDFDEIIVSTRPKRLSKWLRRDLLHRIERLGLPVTAIVPRGRGLSNKEALETMADRGFM